MVYAQKRAKFGLTNVITLDKNISVFL